jgi:excisionase family DNA binding protein
MLRRTASSCMKMCNQENELDDRGTPWFEAVLDSKEASRLLGIHPKTLQRMARKGLIPGKKVGRLWRFPASELDRYLKSGYTQNTIRAA